MRHWLPDKYKHIVAAIVFTLSTLALPLAKVSATSCAGTAYPGTPCYPYVKVYGGDAFSGAAFTDSDQNSTCSNQRSYNQLYQNNGQRQGRGGIYTYTNVSDGGANHSGANAKQVNGGASSQYGAIALGLIEGPSVVDYSGFYSGGARSSIISGGGSTNLINPLSFSNYQFPDPTNIAWGGNFDDSAPPDNNFVPHCINDYLNTLQNNPQPYPIGTTNLDLTNVGQWVAGDNTRGRKIDRTITGGRIVGGQNLTYFVYGDVAITGDIKYDQSTYNDTNVPKFALVVMGNIYIKGTVKQLDGLYISEPFRKPTRNGTATAGELSNQQGGGVWDCNESKYQFTAYSRVINQDCNTPLVINGAVIALELNIVRINGDARRATAAEDLNSNLYRNAGTITNCEAGPTNCNIAEIINYTPEMVIGDSFFGSTGPGGSPPPPPAPTITAITSLPPLY